MEAITHINKLNCYAQPVTGLADAAFKQYINIQLAPHQTDVFLLILESERCGSGNNSDVFEFGQDVDDYGPARSIRYIWGDVFYNASFPKAAPIIFGSYANLVGVFFYIRQQLIQLLARVDRPVKYHAVYFCGIGYIK